MMVARVGGGGSADGGDSIADVGGDSIVDGRDDELRRPPFDLGAPEIQRVVG